MPLLLLCVTLLAYKSKHLSLSPVSSSCLRQRGDGAFSHLFNSLSIYNKGLTSVVMNSCAHFLRANCTNTRMPKHRHTLCMIFIQLSMYCQGIELCFCGFHDFLDEVCNSETLTKALDRHMTLFAYILWLFKTCHFSTGIPYFIALHFILLCQYCIIFKQLKVCGHPALVSIFQQ